VAIVSANPLMSVKYVKVIVVKETYSKVCPFRGHPSIGCVIAQVMGICASKGSSNTSSLLQLWKRVRSLKGSQLIEAWMSSSSGREDTITSSSSSLSFGS
jgi:hypothetical protein